MRLDENYQAIITMLCKYWCERFNYCTVPGCENTTMAEMVMGIAKNVLVAIALLGVLYLCALAYFASPLSKPSFTVRKEATLPADQMASWELLSRFEHYPDWNPYLIKVRGTLEVGQQVSVDLVDGNFDDVITVTPTISELQPEASFCWKGRFWLPGMLDTRHCFVLEEISDTQTKLVQFEEFGGLVASAFPVEENMSVHVEAAFDSMHQAMIVELQQVTQ